MLVEGKITSTGVLAPEACGLDPDEFFHELSNILVNLFKCKLSSQKKL
jgi:hypothetical protein